jgi:hypothetical protein
VPVLQAPLAYDCAPQIHGTFQATVPPMPSCIPAHQTTTHDCLAQDDHSFDGLLTHSQRIQANSGAAWARFMHAEKSPAARSEKVQTNLKPKRVWFSSINNRGVPFPSGRHVLAQTPTHLKTHHPLRTSEALVKLLGSTPSLNENLITWILTRPNHDLPYGKYKVRLIIKDFRKDPWLV